MAKKKDLSCLINNFSGDAAATPERTEAATALTAQEAKEAAELPADIYELVKDNPALLNNLMSFRLATKMGRPTTAATDRTNESRATIVVDRYLFKEIKYISVKEGRTLKDLMNEILAGYKAQWEKEHGPINMKHND